MADNIYLTGFMGTGKSSVGSLLAFKLGRIFVEIDAEIETREKASIVDIFDRRGEAYFRAREKELLAELSGKKDLVVSCGGGIVLEAANRRILKSTGLVICLFADPAVIHDRVRACGKRPLLNVPDPESRISELLGQRREFYREADINIDTSSLAVEEVVDLIIKNLKDE